MAKALIYSISLLLMLTSYGNAQNCNYQLHLQSGQKYYVKNPHYPYYTNEETSCRWEATSNYRINLTCETFHLQSDSSCTDSVLLVYNNGSEPKRYCGYGKFSIESSGNQMTINYTSSSFANFGRFNCVLQAIEPNFQHRYKKSTSGFNIESRIVGGSETRINEFPMMAGLLDNIRHVIWCGATIISNKYALTAAHCLKNQIKENFDLVVGEHDTRTNAETSATKLYQIERFIIHPRYAPRQNDIGIVAVKGTIEFSSKVGPVCLPFRHRRESFVNENAEIIGWGTEYFSGPTSPVLLKASVSIIENRRCRQTYPDVSNDEMCTFSLGRDACQFDSGGPVLWKNPVTGNLVLIGIITGGAKCGENVPGLNTRLINYLDWIQSNTRGVTIPAYCRNE